MSETKKASKRIGIKTYGKGLHHSIFSHKRENYKQKIWYAMIATEEFYTL